MKYAMIDIKQSYIDLHRIYKPTDIDKFTRDFVKKYGLKGYEDELKRLVQG